MITIRKAAADFDFVIGPHVIPLGREEARQLLELICSQDRRPLAFGPWRMEKAGAFDHPREKRHRTILHHGERKWHLTEEELELLCSLIDNHLNQ